MKIKKVDDKPMVIHTKQKAKLHTHEPKQASIKGSNIYTIDRDPTKKNSGNGNYRKSTVHQVQKEGLISKYRKSVKQSAQSIKVKDNSLRNSGMVAGKVTTDQLEGGQELQQAAMIMYEGSKPVTGVASRGAELFKRKAVNQVKRRIKKVDAGKKIAKKGAKVVLVYKKVDRPFDATKTDRNGVDRYYGANAGNADAVETKLKEMGADYIILESDISNEEAIKEIYSTVLQKYERIDVLFNNAATDDETGCDTIETITRNVIDDTFAVNVRGSILMTREFIKHRGDYGRIINVSTDAAQIFAG